MARESARDKAGRLLLEGRVIVVACDRAYIDARVRGEGAIHQTGYVAGRWYCTCPARQNCSHVWALKRISAVDLGQTGPLRKGETDAGVAKVHRR